MIGHQICHFNPFDVLAISRHLRTGPARPRWRPRDTRGRACCAATSHWNTWWKLTALTLKANGERMDHLERPEICDFHIVVNLFPFKNCDDGPNVIMMWSKYGRTVWRKWPLWSDLQQCFSRQNFSLAGSREDMRKLITDHVQIVLLLLYLRIFRTYQNIY